MVRCLCRLQHKLLDDCQVRGGSTRNMDGALIDLRDAAVALVDLASRQRGTHASACIVSADFAGASNNVMHSFRWQVLRRYGVDDDAIRESRAPSYTSSIPEGSTERLLRTSVVAGT